MAPTLASPARPPHARTQSALPSQQLCGRQESRGQPWVLTGKSPGFRNSSNTVVRAHPGVPDGIPNLVGYTDHVGAARAAEQGRGHWQAPDCLCRSPDRDQAVFCGSAPASAKSPCNQSSVRPTSARRQGGSRPPWSAQQFRIERWDSPWLQASSPRSPVRPA